MLITNDMIKENYKHYHNKNTKLSREIRDGKYIKIKNGLFETDSNTPGIYLASAIYGPSYLSFDFALFYYGVIPEKVTNYTSATFEKKKKKKYTNPFGTFLYRDVPSEVYFYGIRMIEENGYTYQIATLEKALCDKLYTLSPVNNIKELEELLFVNLRIDKDEFNELNIDDIGILEKKYHSTNVTTLYKFLRGMKKYE